jgi:hypothetical protein
MKGKPAPPPLLGRSDNLAHQAILAPGPSAPFLPTGHPAAQQRPFPAQLTPPRASAKVHASCGPSPSHLRGPARPFAWPSAQRSHGSPAMRRARSSASWALGSCPAASAVATMRGLAHLLHLHAHPRRRPYLPLSSLRPRPGLCPRAPAVVQ